MAVVDRAQLADLLRSRREALQPEDVGLPRGPRRRTGGLRREEVAVLCGMSSDYWGRLEQGRSTQPSEQMLTAIARGLRLSLDERDHLFVLAGHGGPQRARRTDHVDSGIMRVLDRLTDTPAMVVSDLGQTLVQNPAAVALFGDETRHEGLSRFVVHRWFTDPGTRAIYLDDDHDLHGRTFVADLRLVYGREGPASLAAEVVDDLLTRSEEFAAVWAEHEVGRKHPRLKRLVHPEVGRLDVHCQTLYDTEQQQGLLVFTAPAGSESAERLRLLAVVGAQRLGG
jgi:transcriptional regulator with XRE-family HTH domain